MLSYKETLIRYTILIAINNYGEANDGGEKLVRGSSTQHLQISTEGGETTIDEVLLRIIMKRNNPLKVMVSSGEIMDGDEC